MLARLFSLVCGVLLLWAVIGCAGGPATNSVGSTAPAAAAPPTGSLAGPGLHGHAQGGPQAIVGAHVYLFAVNEVGYGAPSIPLIDPTAAGTGADALGGYVLTDGQGNFDLSYRYTCAPGQFVYVLSMGGSPGGTGSSNAAAGLLTTMGRCPADGNLGEVRPFIDINQVSTVVTAYALAGFMTDGAHVSSSATANAVAGVSNAFSTMDNLMDVAAGTAYSQTPESSGVVPQAEINTLANALVPCIQGTGSCADLFALTPNRAGIAPADTVQAMLNVIRNPGANVAALFRLGSNRTFLPQLAAAPNDWTLAVTYFAPNMAGGYFAAVDAVGNLWVPDFANNTLTEFSPTGDLVAGEAGFSGGGLSHPFAVALDAQGNVWVSNFGSASSGPPSVSAFAANGSAITSNGFACGTSCSFLAVDLSGNLWVSGAPQVRTIKSSGVALSAFSTNGFSAGVAIDSQGRGWTIGSGRNLSRLTLPATVAQFSESVTAAAGNDLTAVAIDSSDGIWFASARNGALGKYGNDGAAISPAGGFTGGGLRGPAGVAIDGADQVWVANRDGNSISVFSNAGAALSGESGYRGAGVSNPRGIVVDPSGDVWVTNFTGNSVTELVGAATPVATPLLPNNHGHRP